MPKPAETSLVGMILFALFTIAAVVATVVGISVPWGSTGDLSQP